MFLNKVIICGNVVRDPELKKSPAGISVVVLRLAIHENFRSSQTGDVREVTTFVDVTVWDRQAETCCQYIRKGNQVLVDGRLLYEEWTSKDGEKRSRLSVRADRVQFTLPPRVLASQNEISE